MIYFSEVLNRRVITEDNAYVGQLTDFIFQAKQKAYITKMVIRTTHDERIFVPIKYLKRINCDITINKLYEVVSICENELFIKRNLLDKQIIDIAGNKVVRVNDVVIQNHPEWYVIGVDVGLLSILRWLNLEKPVRAILRFFRYHHVSKILSWADIQPLELARRHVRLRVENEQIERMRPEDLADHLEKTNISNVRRLLATLQEGYAAEVISNLVGNYQTALFQDFSVKKAAKLLSLFEADETLDILLTLPRHKREKIIDLLPENKKHAVLKLLPLSRTPIGELISSEYIQVGSEAEVKDIIELIRKNAINFFQLNYIYVVNKQDQLVGVCNLHELLLQKFDTPIYRFMNQNLVVIYLTTPKEIAVKKLLRYKLYALPVIDANRTLIGVVNIDDVMEYLLSYLD